MADIAFAYEKITSTDRKPCNIEHFFTQRKVDEMQEFISEVNMERKTRKVKKTINYVALTLPEVQKKDFELELYGDLGYQYKGRINSYEGNIPHLLIPLQGDSQLFVHINIDSDKDDNDNDNDNNKKYISFIPVPKRYQTIDNKSKKEIVEVESEI